MPASDVSAAFTVATRFEDVLEIDARSRSSAGRFRPADVFGHVASPARSSRPPLVVPPSRSGGASWIRWTYGCQWVDGAQSSDLPAAQSVLPMYAIAMCPSAPAVTSGKAVEWIDGGLSWVCGVQ